jgi:integrase
MLKRYKLWMADWHDENGLRKRKKSPGLASVRKLVEAYAQMLSTSDRQMMPVLVAREFAAAAGKLTLDELTCDTANQLVAGWRVPGKYSEWTLYGRINMLRRVLQYLERCGGHPRIRASLKRPPYPGARTVRSSPEEVQRLLAAASPWLRCAIVITAHHGLRISEALRLSAADYDEATQTISGYRTKGNQTNTLPASDELQEYFRTAPQTTDKHESLVWRLHGGAMTIASFYNHWHRLLRKAGANPKLHPHDLRRTIALQAYGATKDLKVCQAILGHRSLASTAIYLEGYGAPDLREIMRALTKGTPASAGRPFNN